MEREYNKDINVTEIQFLGQCNDSGGQELASKEYQEVGADLELPF